MAPLLHGSDQSHGQRCLSFNNAVDYFEYIRLARKFGLKILLPLPIIVLSYHTETMFWDRKSLEGSKDLGSSTRNGFHSLGDILTV